jgi:hypothetical protein
MQKSTRETSMADEQLTDISSSKIGAGHLLSIMSIRQEIFLRHQSIFVNELYAGYVLI